MPPRPEPHATTAQGGILCHACYFSRKDLRSKGSGLQQLGEWKVFGKPRKRHRDFSFSFFSCAQTLVLQVSFAEK